MADAVIFQNKGGPPQDLAGWLGRVLVGLDRLANAIALGNPAETISGRLGRSGSWLGKLLSIFQRDHALRAVEYTPWGTVDPHGLAPIDAAIAADWNAALAVILSPADLDAFPAETKAAAQRALVRYRIWSERGGRERWKAKMARELDVGDLLAGGYRGYSQHEARVVALMVNE